MNKGYIHLDLEESLRVEVIDLNKTTTAAQGKPLLRVSSPLFISTFRISHLSCVSSHPPAEPLKQTTNQQEKEKTLLKLYINFGVLTRLGYEEEQVLRVSFQETEYM